MGKWVDKEKGPECFCGCPTMVSMFEDGRAVLLCIFHTGPEGAMFPLPNDGRPDSWPNVTHEEMQKLVDQGIAEEEALEKGGE